MLYVIATLNIRPGTLPDIMKEVMPCIEATRKEKGCISYDLMQSQTDPDTLAFVERWESRAALESHFKEPHLIKWRDASAKYTTGRKIEIIEDGKVQTL